MTSTTATETTNTQGKEEVVSGRHTPAHTRPEPSVDPHESHQIQVNWVSSGTIGPQRPSIARRLPTRIADKCARLYRCPTRGSTPHSAGDLRNGCSTAELLSAPIKNSRCSQAAALRSLAGSIGYRAQTTGTTLEQLITVRTRSRDPHGVENGRSILGAALGTGAENKPLISYETPHQIPVQLTPGMGIWPGRRGNGSATDRASTSYRYLPACPGVGRTPSCCMKLR
jgi:hypothetical protein